MVGAKSGAVGRFRGRSETLGGGRARLEAAENTKLDERALIGQSGPSELRVRPPS